MKKSFRLHYSIVDGLAPNDRDRNYLCFTLIEPNEEGVKTLALDEDILHKILNRCKSEEQKTKLHVMISNAALNAIKEGKNAGSFIITV